MEKTTVQKPRLAVFAVMVSLFWMSLYSYQPILSVHSYGLGASTVLVGLIISAYGFTQMFCRIPIGLTSDRLGKRKPFVIAGCAVGVLAALGMGFAKDPVVFLLFRGVSGVAASFWVSFTVLFSSYYDPADAPGAMARVMLFSQCGRMLSMLAGGFVSENMGNSPTFMMAAIIGGVALVASLFITEVPPAKKEPQRFTTQLSVGLDRTLLIVSTLALLMQIIQWGATVGFTPKFAADIGCTPGQLGLFAGLAELGMILASLLNTRLLLKRFGPRPCVLVGIVINAIATILIALFAFDIPTLFVLQFMVGLGNGLAFPLLMGLAIQNIPGLNRGVAMGFYQSIYALGMFIGPNFTSLITENLSLRWGLGLTGATGFLTFAFAFLALKKKPGKAG